MAHVKPHSKAARAAQHYLTALEGSVTMQSELEVLFGWKILRFYCSKIKAIVVIVIIVIRVVI